MSRPSLATLNQRTSTCESVAFIAIETHQCVSLSLSILIYKRTDNRGPRSVHTRLTTLVFVNGSEPGPFLIHTHVTLNPGYTLLTRFTIIPFISCNTFTRVVVYTVSANSTIHAWIGINTVINVYKLEAKTKSLEVKKKV